MNINSYWLSFRPKKIVFAFLGLTLYLPPPMFFSKTLAAENNISSDVCAVYVQNFSANIVDNEQAKKRLLSRAGKTDQMSPTELKNKLSLAIVDALVSQGIKAEKAPPDQLPKTGLLVSGSIDAKLGNRLTRAAIGFGGGAVELSIKASVSNLAELTSTPLSINKDGASNKLPGAIISKSPYVLAVKLLREKNTAQRELQTLAEKIATDVSEHSKHCRIESP